MDVRTETKKKSIWQSLPSGWRYFQVVSTAFVVGAHPSQPGEASISQRCSMTGGVEFPAGSCLVQGPNDQYATAVRQDDFPAWLDAHKSEAASA